MATLLLGPVLRHVGLRDTTGWATVWVETDSRCRVRVTCGSGQSGEATTFRVEDHYYALVMLRGLPSGAVTEYTVHLDDDTVWPPTDSPLADAPASVIRTPVPGGARRVAFGSCRVASPAPEPGGTTSKEAAAREDELGIDALDAYAVRAAGESAEDLPDLLLMLGDQVYADETSDATRRKITERRGPDPGLGKRGVFRRGRFGKNLDDPPGAQVADFEEYTWLYRESWGDGPIRWLLSTVPVGMIFDDHDVHDDWNTSASWREHMQTLRWWPERIVGGLMTYWIYQHIGNLSPDELEADEMWQRVQKYVESGEDAAPVLREFAVAADTAVSERKGGYRFSFWRDLGPLRLVVLDSRCGRVLVDGERSMLADATFDWLDERLDGDYTHLALGSSVPWLLNPTLQAAEAWNERLAARRDPVRSYLGEQIRRAFDLEHWGAFGASFERLADVLRGESAKPGTQTISVLSGDVHHSYISSVQLGGGAGPARVYQLTCSPVHNLVPNSMRRAFTALWSHRATRMSDAWFHRLLGVPRPTVDWQTEQGPVFGNCIATLELSGDTARVTMETSVQDDGGVTLRPVITRTL